jgi:hypothetical protein
MKVQIAHADTCLSDFWTGDSRPHLQIPVYRGMTPKAVREALRDEIRQGAVAGNDDDARCLADDWIPERLRERADALIRKVYAAINRDVKPAKKGARRLFLDLEPETDDCCESVYAFFVIIVTD